MSAFSPLVSSSGIRSADSSSPPGAREPTLRRLSLLAMVIVILVAGCGTAAQPGRSAVGPAEPHRVKRVVAAITGDPATQSNRLNPGNLVPGQTYVEQLMNDALTRADADGNTIPRLAEQVPSLQNGLWKTFPDGHMEVTWKLRAGPEWHDGVPVTIDDVLFTIQVGRDREIPALRNSTFDLFESIETLDDRTFVVRWRQPNIDADVFSPTLLPKHTLETAFQDNKASLTEHPYFLSTFFGTGAFKIREWIRGSHVSMTANDRYYLGRPKLDEIEIRFITDQNTLLANILAGEVELVMDRGLSLDQGLTIRAQWPLGKVVAQQSNIVSVYPQFINPDPVIVTDLRFRRALLHALDRQSLADAIYAGLVPVAHTYFSQLDPAYAEVSQGIARYEYDPRQALQIMEGLGYSRAADGQLRDSSGQPIKLPVRSTTTRAERAQMLLAIIEGWRQLGIAADPDIAPPQLVADREYQSVFPAVQFTQRGGSRSSLKDLHTKEIPLSENRFQGNNISRYSNAGLDSLIDQFVVTIPLAERTQVIAQIVRNIADQLPLMPIVYGMDVLVIANRLRNVGPNAMAWNAFEWDATN